MGASKNHLLKWPIGIGVGRCSNGKFMRVPTRSRLPRHPLHLLRQPQSWGIRGAVDICVKGRPQSGLGLSLSIGWSPSKWKRGLKFAVPWLNFDTFDTCPGVVLCFHLPRCHWYDFWTHAHSKIQKTYQLPRETRGERQARRVGQGVNSEAVHAVGLRAWIDRSTRMSRGGKSEFG